MRKKKPDDAGGLGWADVDACTLPTAERPLRLAEFDDLFATSLRSVDCYDGVRARLQMRGGDELAARTRRLAEAESSCCSFWTFNVAEDESGDVALDVEVPAAYTDVLAGLVSRVEAAMAAAS